ncbi:MAG: response regulator [Brachymonas sp.]|nr:response regulator [Brachymonas sp.]
MALNVLVVDDNSVDRIRMEKLMMDAGYMVTSAINGAQAIEMAKRIKPSLIMMDVNMPEMDGFAATRNLRNDPETKDIPVILVTAKDQKADKAWGQMLGAKGYITKPYTDEQVLNAVRSVI